MTETDTVSGRELTLTLERVLRLVRDVATAGDVSLTAAALLARLTRTGPMRVTDIARAEGTSQPAMTQLVNRLAKQGLLERVADEADRRAVLVEITEAGREVLEHRRGQRAETLATALAQLDEADRAAIGASLPAFGRLVDVVLES